MIDLVSALEAVLFAAGDEVPISRLSLVFGVDERDIISCAAELKEQYESQGRGLRIVRMEDKLQMCSAPDYAQLITKVLEHRKPPSLSQPALETLAVVAYFQPVTRAYIDQIRGVDSSYTLSVLLDKGLIEAAGRLEVPGRPVLFRTTPAFLRTMGITELSELPVLPDMKDSEGILALQQKIDEINYSGMADQMSIREITEGPEEE